MLFHAWVSYAALIGTLQTVYSDMVAIEAFVSESRADICSADLHTDIEKESYHLSHPHTDNPTIIPKLEPQPNLKDVAIF